MIGPKTIQISNNLSKMLGRAMASRMQTNYGDAGLTSTSSLDHHRMPPGTRIKDPPRRDPANDIERREPHVPKEEEKKMDQKPSGLEFGVEPMGEDIAVVLKPPAELKDTNVDMQEERAKSFEKADYMEKGADMSGEEQRASHHGEEGSKKA